MVANAIGHLGEAAWHHPDLLVTFPRVEVRLTNHDAGGITDKDFELARKIEDLVQWQPAKAGGALKGPPASQPYVKYDDMTLLLASVTGAAEAEGAVAHGADIVDLRGEPTLESVREMLAAVAGRKAVCAGVGDSRNWKRWPTPVSTT